MNFFKIFLIAVFFTSCSSDESETEPQRVVIDSNTQIRGTWVLEAILETSTENDITSDCDLEYAKITFNLNGGAQKQEGKIYNDGNCYEVTYIYDAVFVANRFRMQVFNNDNPNQGTQEFGYNAFLKGDKLYMTLISSGTPGISNNRYIYPTEDQETYIYQKQ